MKRKKYFKRLNDLNLPGVFPDGLSDEAAWALRECLHNLVMACEYRYLSQLMRHRQKQPPLYDPEQPWKRSPEF